MSAWAYFSLALPGGSTAVVDGSGLAAKVYFPRAVLPLVQIVTALYGYGVTVAILLVLCPLLHVTLGVATLLLIPGTLLLVALTCGFVLVDSAVHVYFRDVRYFVSAASMVWLYVTPIIYRPQDVHGLLRTVINLNPMTGIVDMFHAATVGHVGSMTLPLAVTTTWIAVLLAMGTFLHCRFNRVFADLL
jgi:ABC-2 type transport system permease protein